MERSGIVAQRGVMAVQGGLQALVAQATFLPGPLGRVATGFASIGIGSTAVTGVLAAGGAIVAVWRLATSVISDMERATAGLNREFASLAAQGAPNVGLLNAILETQQRMAQLEKPAFKETALRILGRVGLIGLGDVAEAMKTSRLSQIGTLENMLRLQRPALAEARADLLATLVPPAARPVLPRLATDFGAAAAGLRLPMAPQLAAPFSAQTIADMEAFNARIERSAQLLEALRTPQELHNSAILELHRMVEEGIFPVDQLGRAIEFLGEEADQAAQSSRMFTATMIHAGAGVISSLAAGGGLPGLLQGAGGIVGLLATKNPALLIPGAIIQGIGSIFSVFDRSEERRHRENIDVLRRIAREVGLERQTFIVVDGNGNVLQELHRLEEHDAVTRVPAAVGARG